MRRSFLLLVGSVLSLSLLSGCSGGSSPTTSSTPPPTTPPPTPAVNPPPTVASITPGSVVAGSAAQTLTFTGTGYISSTAATLSGATLQTKYVSATSMQVVVPASALAAGQVVSFVLSNPAPGGGNSAASSFSIMSPTPSVKGLSPQSVPQGAATTVTVNGSGFEANSVVLWNGAPRTTTFVNGTTLQVSLTAADLQSYGTGQISVNNPGPGGSNTTPTELVVAANVPTILNIGPATVAVNTTSSNVPTSVGIYGSGFAANATVQANGHFVPVTSQSGTFIGVSLPSTFFASPGSILLVVSNPGTPVVQSNTATLTVAVPTASFSVSPNYAAAGSPDTTITIWGNGFFKDSVVEWNTTPLSTTYVNATQLTAIIPSALISGFVQSNIQVSTPESQALAMPPQPFTTFLALPINDIVYNAVDGLIYTSVAGSAGNGLGNSIAGIDPVSGVIVKSIFVGSEPTRIALSSDGTQLFAGLNGANAIRQVNLTTGTAGMQFPLSVATGVYSSQLPVVQSLAVLPGQPNSVAVYDNNGVVTIYDSGVARAKTSSGLNVYFNQNYGSLSFGSSASTLYLNAQTVSSYNYVITIDGTGVTSANSLSNTSGGTVQYDHGRLYLSSGIVLDANNGNQLGQFSASSTYSNAPAAVSGPIFSDSTLGRAWIVPTSGQVNTNQILAFDETTFNPVGSIPLTGIGAYPSSNYNTNPADLIRWGQNGLAFHTASQLYVFQGPIVKDISSSPADLSVTIQAPTTATPGTEFNYTVQLANLGPNPAQGVTLTTVLPASVIGGTVTPSQGTCSGGSILYCDLGTIANASTASVTIAITPTVSGTLGMTATSSSISFDPVSSNNQTTASTTVTGNAFNALPSVTQLSPIMVAAGSPTLTLTVDGTGFTSGSTVLWNGQALPTTFVSNGQMTATADASLIQQLGWAQVSVSTPAPGGGQSAGLPLHIYQILNVPANAINFDPFTRKLYAVLPSTSTPISGNSLVVIDPTNGSIGSPIQVGSEPNVLSETSDGNYLFIGLSGAKSLGRFNLLNQTLDLTVPIYSTANFTSGEVAAANIATIPGSDSSVALEIAINGGIGIFDISGSTGTFRGSPTQLSYGSAPTFVDPTHFYSYSYPSTFYRYTINPSGSTLIDTTSLNGFGGYPGKFAVDGGLVFGANGGIANPNTTPPSQVALLPIGTNPYSPTLSLSGSGVVPYQAESKAFVISENDAGTIAYFLQRFDTKQFTLDQQIQLPGNSGSAPTGTRWGQDGLAYVVPNTATSQTPQIFLLRGPFVLPAEAATNSAPTLTTADQTTITAGSGNLYLTVTGTGFLPGAVVLWNGSPRTTSFVDAAHLQVAIPASDLTSAATITLSSQNPGSTSSNNLSITVQ